MFCFDRENECKTLWRNFDEGKNILMLAPRRIGKTVLLNRLREMAPKQKYRAVMFEMAGFRDEKDFFRQLCAAIQEEQSMGKKVLTAFTARLASLVQGRDNPGADWRQWLVQTDWKEFAGHLLAQLDEDETSWVVMVDELPIFIQSLREKDDSASSTFLYWLRNMRQKHRKIRWIYAGSIGLDSVARRYNLEGALNDLTIFTLKPFDEQTAKAFLCTVAQRQKCTIEEPALQLILDRLGWLAPYYLERIVEDASELAMQATRPKHSPANEILDSLALHTIGKKEAENALENMLALEKRNYWSGWREHLDKNFTEPELGRLHAILLAVAKNPGGTSKDTLLSLPTMENERTLHCLLDILLNDGYLVLDPETRRYRFQMHLLREWWQRHVAMN